MKKACIKCGSVNINYHKAVYKNSTFHIYITCEDCFARYGVKRSKYSYDKTKLKEWLVGEDILKQRKEYSSKRKRLRNLLKSIEPVTKCH